MRLKRALPGPYSPKSVATIRQHGASGILTARSRWRDSGCRSDHPAGRESGSRGGKKEDYRSIRLVGRRLIHRPLVQSRNGSTAPLTIRFSLPSIVRTNIATLSYIQITNPAEPESPPACCFAQPEHELDSDPGTGRPLGSVFDLLSRSRDGST